MKKDRSSLLAVKILAVLCIAMAVGLFVAVGHVLIATIVDPLPFPDSSQLVDIWETRPPNGSARPMTYLIFQELERRNSVFSSVAAFWGRDCITNGKDAQTSVSCTIVSGNFFQTLKAKPLLGRSLLASDDTPAADFVVVLSYGEWQRSFGGDKSIIGKLIWIDGSTFQIVGVMPKDFQFPIQGNASSLYFSLAADYKISDTDRKLAVGKEEHYLRVIGRLRPEVTLSAARGNLVSVMHAITQDLGYDQGISANVLQMKDEVAKDSAKIARVAVYAIGSFTISACLTLLLVMFLREVERHDTLALMLVFGARSRDFFTFLARDAFILGVTGSGLGFLLAWACIEIERSVFGSGMVQNRLGFKNATAIICLGIVLASVSGIIAVLRVLKVSNLNSALGRKTASFAVGNVWLQRIVTGFQVCIAVALVVVATGLATTNLKLIKENRGFDSRSVYVIKLKTIGKVQPAIEYSRLFGALQDIPGVSSGVIVALPPYEGLKYTIRCMGDNKNKDSVAAANYLSPGYFSTLQIPILEGRDFAPADDTTGENIAIISKTLAETLWPNGQALGKRIWTGKGYSVPYVIVGVADDVKEGAEGGIQNPNVYFPYYTSSFGIFNSIVRTSSLGGSGAAAAFQRLQALHGPVTPVGIDAMDDLISQSHNVLHAEAQSTLLFAAISVGLASLSIFGVTWLTLALRTRELAIRIACGATLSALFRVLLRTEGVVIGIGSIAGLALALMVNQFMKSVISGFVPCSWLQVTAILAGLGGVYFVASAVPMLFFWRATDFWVPLTSQ